MADAPRFYIFHGEDEFSQRETLAELTHKLGGDPAMIDLNTSRLDGQSLRIGELVHVCNSIPFLCEKRLVIVSGLLERLSGKDRQAERDALLDYLPTLPPTTKLIFLERKQLSERNPFIRLATSSGIGYIKSFGPLQGRALEHWIQQRVQAGGGSIHPQAIAILASDVSEDLQLLDLEIAKLLAYSGLSRPIRPEDVELLTPIAAQTNIFDLVDAIGQQRGQKAVALLRRSLDAGAEPLYLLAMIARQFRLLIQVKEKLEQGVYPNEVGRAVGIHPYVAGKLVQQAATLTMPRLESIFRQLLDTDVAIKTGLADPIVALDLLVVQLAGIAA